MWCVQTSDVVGQFQGGQIESRLRALNFVAAQEMLRGSTVDLSQWASLYKGVIDVGGKERATYVLLQSMNELTFVRVGVAIPYEPVDGPLRDRPLTSARKLLLQIRPRRGARETLAAARQEWRIRFTSEDQREKMANPLAYFQADMLERICRGR